MQTDRGRRAAMNTIAGGMAAWGGISALAGTASADGSAADSSDLGTELEGVETDQSCRDGVAALRLRNPNPEPVGSIMYGPDADDEDDGRERYVTTLNAAGTDGDTAEFAPLPPGSYTIITRVLDETGEMVLGPTGRIEEASIRLTCSEPVETPAATDGCVVFDQSGQYVLEADVECVEITAESVRLDARRHLVNRVTIRADEATVRNVGGAIDFSEGVFELRSADDCRIVGNVVGEMGFRLVDANENLVANNEKPRQGNGISLENSEENYVLENAFEGETAVTLRGSDRNTLLRNETDTEDFNLRFVDSHRNRIVDNRIRGEVGTTGISLRESHRNVLQGNDVSANNVGISLADAARNILRENRLEGDGGVGIELTDADRNLLLRNRMRSYDVGIRLVDADRNRIIRNRVCDVSDAVQIDSNSTDNLVRATVTDCSED